MTSLTVTWQVPLSIIDMMENFHAIEKYNLVTKSQQYANKKGYMQQNLQWTISGKRKRFSPRFLLKNLGLLFNFQCKQLKWSSVEGHECEVVNIQNRPNEMIVE